MWKCGQTCEYSFPMVNSSHYTLFSDASKCILPYLLQDIETESDDMEVQQIPGASSQQQQQQQGQQAVALVLPRVEQQTSTTQTTQTQAQLIVEQSVVVASSQANSSNTVTTSQAGVKRQRDMKGDSTSRIEEKSGGPSQVFMNVNFLTGL